MKFELQTQSGQARRARLTFARGVVETPVFMPVGTVGAVKGITPAELQEVGAMIVLANTFHLLLRPGTEIIADHGDLHDFMGWGAPILTDSGGFQVFSLKDLRHIDEKGVSFRSPVDGKAVFLGPEESMRVQEILGSDIIMAFDECTPYPVSVDEAQQSMALSMRWAQRCRDFHADKPGSLFGIIQGGVYPQLRHQSLQQLMSIGFDGYAIGGLSVGETKDEMRLVLSSLVDVLPTHHPHYLMGVGTPEDILHAVGCGVDMFDCVLPTRNARHGWLFTNDGNLKIKNSIHRRDTRPIDAQCACYTCRHFSRAYLRHLYQIQETLAARLMTLHNLHYYQQLMAQIRTSIEQDRFAEFATDVVARRQPDGKLN